MILPRLNPVTHIKGLAFMPVLVLLLTIFVSGSSASAACASAPQDKGTITAQGVVPSTGTYYIWSRNKTSTASNNGYYLKVDSGCTITVGDANLPVNSWTWVNYQDGNTASRMSVNLSAGTHSFNFYGLDPSVQVDRLVLTADSNCNPTGTGDNCTNGNTTPPIVVTTPGTTGPTVNGIVQTGSNNPNSKTTVKVDGKEIASGTGLVGVDTSNLSDGFHDLTIQITNPDGTVQTVTKRILVHNNLPFWKKPYVWLYKATGFNKTLTNLIAFTAIALVLTGLGVGIFIGWSRRVWEKMPLIKNIHLPFLKVPNFMGANSGGGMATAGSAIVGDMHGHTTTGTSHTNPLRFSILGHSFNPNLPAIATIAAFAIVGSAAILYSSAAANGFVVEPESGAKTGVTTISDSSASGSSAIQFGTGVCPAGQTGTPPNCVTPPPPQTCPAGTTGTYPNCTPISSSGSVPCPLTKAAKACWMANTGLLGGVTEAQVLAGGTSYTHYSGHVDIYGDHATLTAWSGVVSTISNTGTVNHAWIDGCVAMHSSDAELTDSLIRVNWNPPNGGEPYCYNDSGGGYSPLNTGAGGSNGHHLAGSTKHGTIDGVNGLALIKNVIVDANNMPIDDPYHRGQPCIGASDFLADHVQCTGAHKGFYMAYNAKLTESMVVAMSTSNHYAGCTVGDCYNHAEDIFMDTSRYTHVIHNWLGAPLDHATGAINDGNSWPGVYGWQMITDNFLFGDQGTGITFNGNLSYTTVARNVFAEPCGYQSGSGGKCYYGGGTGPIFGAAPNGSANHNIWGTGADANKFETTGAALPIPGF